MRATAARERSGGPAADRRALTADAVLPVLLLVGMVFAVLAPLRLVQESGRGGVVLALVTGSLSALFLLARAACRITAVRAHLLDRANVAGLAICLLGSLDSFAGLLVTGRPDAGGAVMLYLLCAGTLMYERRYAALAVGLCVVEWLCAAAVHGFAGDWASLTSLVLCSVAVATVLNAAHCRTADRLVRAQQAVLLAATTDELTGLDNRRGLLAAGRRLLRPSATAPEVSLLFLDVDGLKQANDRYGHATGDQLLTAAARALRSAVRPADTVARLGGDEFAVLLADAAGGQVTEVRDRVERALDLAGVSASIGTVQARPGQPIEELLDGADAAMYLVKQQRRRRPPSQRVGSGPLAPAAAEAEFVKAEFVKEQFTKADFAESDPAAEPAWLAAADVAALADLRQATVGVGCIETCFVPFDLLMLSPTAGRVMASCSGLLAAGAVLLLRAASVASTRTRVERHARTLLAVVLLLVGATDVLFVAVVREPWTTTAVMLGIVATGALLESRRAAVLVVLATVVGWVAVAPGHGLAADWSPYAVDVCSAVAMATLLHAVHAGTLRRLTKTLLHLRAVALTDELTGLANRRGFLTAGRPWVERSRRGGRGASVLFLDLDGLKQVNDSQGHAAGDRLIVTAAEALLGATSADELCARMGGDEFTVLLPDCRPADVPARSRQLVAAFAQQRVAVSIGAAHLGPDAVSLEGLVDRADGAMCLVKQHRRAAAAALPL